MIEIRQVRRAEERETENVIREAFWNHYAPAASEHYLIHQMRRSEDYLPALDLVTVEDGRIMGNVLSVRSQILGDDGHSYEVLTMGSIGVLPSFQGKGAGKTLIRETMKIASSLGERAILLTGDPDYYSKLGFIPAETFGIRTKDDMYADFLLAFELYEGGLSEAGGRYIENAIYETDEKEVKAFDRDFPKKEIIPGTPGQKKLEIMAKRVRPFQK